jgi:hypothetical protein
MPDFGMGVFDSFGILPAFVKKSFLSGEYMIK